MASFEELIRAGYTKVRLPEWNPLAYLLVRGFVNAESGEFAWRYATFHDILNDARFQANPCSTGAFYRKDWQPVGERSG